MIFIIKLIILLVCVSSSQSDCDVCQLNGVACHSDTQYCLCVEGKPTGDFIECPKGYVCTPATYVCYRADKVKPSCIQGTNKNTSTTDTPTISDASFVEKEQTIKKSYSENTSSKTTLITENKITSAEITNKSITTMKQQAPSKPRDIQTICRDAGSPGIFFADDPSCTSIIVCFAVKGTLFGLRKSCTKGQYFGPGAKYCSKKKPDVCA